MATTKLKNQLRYSAIKSLKALRLPSLRYYPSKEISLKEYLKKGRLSKIRDLGEDKFILTLPNGRVWSSNGTIITEDNTFIKEINRNSNDGSKNIIFYQKSIIKPVKIDGCAVVVAVPWGSVYYHWMVDVLPRLELVKEAGLFENIDHLVINEVQKDFQLVVLNKIGIPLSKTIQVKDIWNTHYQFDQLIVPSFVSEPNRSDLLTILSIEKHFPSLETNSRIEDLPKKIYLGRTKANNRKLLNESDILPFLMMHGFEEIFPENHTVSEQAEIFRNAQIIVGVHGSALTNIVFCKPDTTVFDIAAPEWINNCFQDICELKKLHYIRIIGDKFLRTKDIDKGADIHLSKAKVIFLQESILQLL
ncbi:glycosyltransferase family 61 protein [Pontibacter locisalis]|uniref:Glycosyltransferase family 61 protein n=1 Tax=Pontibacter locisalis TaxID=1719035 RepID=A0ABW5IRD7_9BACT